MLTSSSIELVLKNNTQETLDLHYKAVQMDDYK